MTNPTEKQFRQILKNKNQRGRKTALLLGFGVGLSWAGNLVKY